MDPASINALTFDVFGTVVDWRSSIIREGEAFGKSRGLSLDWEKFADAWRGLYQPAMEEGRSGRRPWVRLDDLHRESLVRLLHDFGVSGLSPAAIDDPNHAWHRLGPWPDAGRGGRPRLQAHPRGVPALGGGPGPAPRAVPHGRSAPRGPGRGGALGTP